MSINNTTNPAAIQSGIESLNRSGGDSSSNASNKGLTDNFDWFSVSDGKALPITAQSEFSEPSNMDAMLSAMFQHLGLS